MKALKDLWGGGGGRLLWNDFEERWSRLDFFFLV